ncbi:hypothetical protein FAGAP_9314 [Fusarium agapanthi]|uniref:DUF7580 domain-containing protein n=1 Tax=Fusarium agapanthi TaxID=1803897 RepID=A0A9P5B3W1_9HYPO|nr:hypothetical protein FAGAP_9314 [Fusarium agapanthi]
MRKQHQFSSWMLSCQRARCRGFEIAGIVLGSIPLLISAIEHYSDSLDRATGFFKWKDGLNSALREFWYQHSSFELTLRKILKDVASPPEIEEMISDPHHELWKSRDLSQALQQMLKFAYRPYISTIKDMHECMKRLAGHLDIDRDTGTADDLEAIIKANKRLSSAGGLIRFEFRRAVKLTMKRKEVRILLEDMKACNNRLDEFINKSEPPTNNSTAGTTVEKLGLSSSLQQIQSYASMLHQTLGKAWSCSAHASHEIRLLLEDRVVRHSEPRSLKKVKPSSKPPCFTITYKSPMSSALWKSAKIDIIDSDEEADNKDKAVRFREAQPRRYNKGQQSMNLRNVHGLTVVGDLCTVFRRYNGIGFGLDDQGVLYETYQDEIKPVCCAENLISLEELLLAHSGMDCFTPLTEEQRYRLSIILTSSFLQLHSTPWLNKHWNQNMVFFSSTSIDDQLVVDLGHPFIAESYGSSPCPNATSIEAKGLTDDSANLLMLAKILLQIKFHGRTSFTKSKENTSNSTAFDRVRESQLLNQWIFQERENLSFAHYNAIQFCIASSNSIDADLWDLKYRQIVLDRVVVPLVNELSHWQGVT